MAAQFSLAHDSLHSGDDPVTRCYLAKLFFVGRRRGNRFGPTALFTWGDIDSLFLSFSAAAKHIEPLRERGSHWEVYDVPSVVVEASGLPKLILAGAGFLSDAMDGFTPHLPPQRKFGYVTKALMAQLPEYVYALQSHRTIPVADFPFVCHHSLPTKPITWRAERWITEPHSAIRLATAIQLWLADAPARK